MGAGQKFTQSERLKAKRAFQRVCSQGQVIYDGWALLYLLPGKEGERRLGFAVGKKLGCAVVRNHSKRLMREVFRRHKEELATGYDFVWVARRPLIGASYATVERVFLRLARKAAQERKQAGHAKAAHRFD